MRSTRTSSVITTTALCVVVLLGGCTAHQQHYAVQFGRVELPPASVIPASFALPVTPIDSVVIDAQNVGMSDGPSEGAALAVVVEPDDDLQYWVRTVWTLPAAPVQTKTWRNVERNRHGSYTMESPRALISGPATFPFVFGPEDPVGEWSVKVIVSRKVLLKHEFRVMRVDASDP